MDHPRDLIGRGRSVPHAARHGDARIARRADIARHWIAAHAPLSN